MKADKTELFEKIPVTQAVLALVVPTVLSQMITVIYNMADTFFVGQVGDPNQDRSRQLQRSLFPSFSLWDRKENRWCCPC